MGDSRFERSYDALRRAQDRGAAIRRLSDEKIIEALTAAALAPDRLLANVLATEATNRVRRLRAALANLGEGVLALGLDGRIQWMNPAAERILRVPWQEAADMPFCDLVEHLDEHGEPVPDSLFESAARGESHAAEGEFFRVAGRGDVCVGYTAAPILGPAREVEGAVISFQDRTEQKRAERALSVDHARYKALFDRIDVGIVSVSTEGLVLDVNPAAERITARPFSESQGRPWAEFVHPDDLENVRDLFGKAVRGEEVEARIRLLHRDGRFVEVDAKGIPILVDGEVVGVHGVLRETR